MRKWRRISSKRSSQSPVSMQTETSFFSSKSHCPSTTHNNAPQPNTHHQKLTGASLIIQTTGPGIDATSDTTFQNNTEPCLFNPQRSRTVTTERLAGTVWRGLKNGIRGVWTFAKWGSSFDAKERQRPWFFVVVYCCCWLLFLGFLFLRRKAKDKSLWGLR